MRRQLQAAIGPTHEQGIADQRRRRSALLVAGWLRPMAPADAPLLKQGHQHLKEVEVDPTYIHRVNAAHYIIRFCDRLCLE